MIPGMPSVASALLARQPQQGPRSFTWGQGGARLSPEQLAMQSRMAQSNIAAGMDTSPVGHWTQGLARVAQALVGNMQQGRLDKQYAAQMAESEAASSAALNALGGGDTRSLAAILSNPLVNDGVKDVAKMQYQAANKAPPAPSEFERRMIAAGVAPGSPEWAQLNRQAVENVTDPIVNITLPGGGAYVGPRSQMGLYAGGGGPASSAPGATPPATLPPDFDFNEGGPTPKASAGFP